jgi:hypothetical protein
MKKQIDTRLIHKFSKQIKEYGITEAFIFCDQFHTTSNYTLPTELIEEMETYLKN